MFAKVFGLVLAAVPFAFAARRLIETGNDLRYIWMVIDVRKPEDAF